jgi:hypothetical protein
MKFLQFLLARLAEPSSMAGAAGVILAAGNAVHGDPQAIGVVLASLGAILAPERSKTAP